MRTRPVAIAFTFSLMTAGAGTLTAGHTRPEPQRIGLSIAPSQSSGPMDGRLLLLVATDNRREPRFQIADGDRTAQVFGIDAEALAAGREVFVDDAILGYPVASLKDLKPGDYWVQGLLHVYETFARSDGHRVKLPPDRGEGQQWAQAPGNLYSDPVKVHLDPARSQPIHIVLDRKIPPLPDLPDTKYVKRIRIQSEKLTKFWGRPTYLGALVVLPEGWDTHPQVKYPLAIYHGHFQREVAGWRETPPDPTLPPADEAGIAKYCPNGHEGDLCDKYGYERMQQDYGYAFFKQWTGPGLSARHHGHDPARESVLRRFVRRELGEPRTLRRRDHLRAAAVHRKDVSRHRAVGARRLRRIDRRMGGARRAGVLSGSIQRRLGELSRPDRLPQLHRRRHLRRSRTRISAKDPFRRTPRPGERDYLGQTRVTVEQTNLKELVLGTHSRSGGQWDIWEAVFSPVGADGYPQRIWDKRTGAIDAAVAAYWRDHYDLVHIMRARLGDARTEAARQDHAQRRLVGQLLPQQRRLSAPKSF